METLANIFISPARQKKFIQQNIFINAPARRNAIALKTNSASTGADAQNY